MKPRLLDLFCCEGGAGEGYRRAGFDVTGIDVEARFARRYPGTFIQADALEYLEEHAGEYDAIHASPPCQRYTAGTRAVDRSAYPDQIAATRAILRRLEQPWIIENVPGAPLEDPMTLCGTMFGLEAVDVDGTRLELRRHRLFESNTLIWPNGQCRHRPGAQVAGVYGGGRTDKDEARNIRRGGYTPKSTKVRADLIGADWMTQHGLSQAIPPAYTEHLGGILLAALED